MYASRAVGEDIRRDHEDILAVSRRNNGVDGISGLLWSEADRYLQLLEGPPESVGGVWERIRRDPRHSDIIVIEDREEDERVFADWAMAGLPGEHPRDTAAHLRLLLKGAPEEVGRLFVASG